MLKIYFRAVFLCTGTLGFSQIPNFPTPQAPSPSSLGDFSNPNYGSPARSVVPSVPHGGLYNPRSSQIQQQNAKMMEEDFRKVAQEEIQRKQQREQILFESWVDSGRNMSYDLPSLSGKAGTQSYYDAFNVLSSIDVDNFSLAESTFTVENAFYGNKKNIAQFKSGIQKTAKQLLQKMKERKQDTESNTNKNLMIFEYFSKDMNLGGTTHKAYQYDFKDYLGEKDWSKMFVSKLISTGLGQCHSMPLYYLMLAEAMGADAHLSFAPNHTYVKFRDDEGEWQNVELTNGIFTTSTVILESGYIKSEALLNKIYMQDMSKRELLSTSFADLASGYIHKFGYDDFVEKVIDKALELYPNNISANMTKSLYQQKRFFNVAKQLGINPENPQELPNLRFFPKAVEQFNEVKAQYDKIDNLGFEFMPLSAYEGWLEGMKKESNKQESEAIKQRIYLYQRQHPKVQKEIQKAKPKQEEKPKYFPIDPNHL